MNERNNKILRLTQTPVFYRRFSKLIWIVLLLALFIIGVLPWVQTIQGQGRVIAYSADERNQSVDSPIKGRLGKWFVQEGSRVKEGDPIVEIFDNDPDLLKRLKLERDAILKNLVAATTAAETSKLNLDRQDKLFKQGISSSRDYEKAKLEYNKFLAEEAKASAELTKIDVKISRQSTQLVLAPRDGIIQRRKSGQGTQQVKEGERIALLVPSTVSRAVEIWIDGNDAPLIHQGDKVRLQFEGWPAIQSYGWPSLAVGTFGGIVTVVDTFIGENGQSRLLIVPDPDSTAWPSSHVLRQGVRSVAFIQINQVTVAFELWRIFNGFPPFTDDTLYQKSEHPKTIMLNK